MPKRSLNEAQVESIIKHLNEGTMTVTALAERYDVHRMTIMDIKKGDTWKKVPGQRPGVKTFLTDVQVEDIVHLINNKPEMKYQEIADMFGVSLSTITAIRHNNVRRHMNFEFIPRREFISEETKAKMMELIKEKKKSMAIVKELGVSRSTVERARRELRNSASES